VETKLVAVVGPGAATGQMGTAVGRPAAATKPQPGAQGWGSLQLRPFGEVAFETFTASQSFKAIFGNSNGFFYGGGVDMAVSRALRFAVSITHFQKTGERAFAYNGQSYQLGIADRVSMTPIAFNVTYRFAGKRFTPYVGGGAGAVVYRETSDLANASDDLSATGTAFQVLGGVEFPLSGSLSLGVEAQYQGVTGILGDTGVSQVFNETDAGGFSVRARIIFGK
jgi:opacity protein-like surface antigen